MSYPQVVDLGTVLEEVPHTWPHLVPQISQLFEAGQGVERAVCLQSNARLNNFASENPFSCPLLSLLNYVRSEPYGDVRHINADEPIPGGNASHRNTGAVRNANRVIYH